MLNYIKFYADPCRDALFLDCWLKIEGIEGNGPQRVGEIRRNPATIALAKFFSTSSWVRMDLSGLPCSRSVRSEKRPSMMGECDFLRYFFIFLVPTVRIPVFKCDTLKSGLIYRYIDDNEYCGYDW